MNVTVKSSGLRELSLDLSKLAGQAAPEARAILQKAALNIKKDWAKRWSGLPHVRHIPSAITYETVVRASSVRAVIGPDKDRTQGALGNILEFGTVKNAPIPGGLPALEAELPKLTEHAEKLMAKMLGPR